MIIVCLGVVPGSAAAADISAGLRAGTPVYRELRLAAALGLLGGPLPGQAPLTRAEAFRLLRSLPTVGVGYETEVPAGEGISPATARRLTRLRNYICPWEEFWDQGEYPITLGGSLKARMAVSYSEITRGNHAPRYLDYGYHHRQGWTGERDGELFLEAEGFALDFAGRLRADGDAVTYRPLALTLRLGYKNLRLVVGREPVSFGPSVHGNLVLSTNARPLDQVRLEHEAPFRLPGPLAGAGEFRAALFFGKLDDPGRNDVISPWITGTRLEYAPVRWLSVGLNRSALFGGEGNGFVVTPRALWELLVTHDEVSVGGEPGNDINQLATVDWSLYLWPVLRSAPLFDGGRLYGEYGGEDKPQNGPLPSATGHTYGLELVAGGVLLRAEATNNRDDANLWYWHRVYTDGYTYRGRVFGHPMGGDSRAQSYDVEVPLGGWGLAVLTMERQEHGFRALPGTPPAQVNTPVIRGTQDTFKLAVEKYLGPFPGAVRVEGRALREFGNLDRLGPLEDWGVTVEWRR